MNLNIFWFVLLGVLSTPKTETVTAVIGMSESKQSDFLVMATAHGEIKKVAVRGFESVRSNGLIAMDLEPGDELGWVRHARRGQDLILATERGQTARFHERVVPSRSRAAGGVKSMRLVNDDRVCSMDVIVEGGSILTVTSGGFAKRTPVDQFPRHNRGVSGVIGMRLSDKSGRLITARVVQEDEEAMVISASGIVLRTPVASISEQGRTAQGVALMSPRRGDRVACIALLTAADDDSSGPLEEEDDEGGTQAIGTQPLLIDASSDGSDLEAEDDDADAATSEDDEEIGDPDEELDDEDGEPEA